MILALISLLASAPALGVVVHLMFFSLGMLDQIASVLGLTPVFNVARAQRAPAQDACNGQGLVSPRVGRVLEPGVSCKTLVC